MSATDNHPISTENISIDICVCTFRRPHVARTLQSIAALSSKPEWQIRVIVADNDDTPSARDRVERTVRETGLSLTYIHVPAFNISIARNACLDAATAPLLAFIDDDELVTTHWLENMLEMITGSNADVVLGPVNAIYGAECPSWMIKGSFHSTRPVFVQGRIITGYSCNVIFQRLSPAVQGLRFRRELGRSGGEDTAYFTSIHKAGGVIAYAPEAIVTEEVPAERATFLWLVKRRFRTGQTHGLTLLERTPGMSARIIRIISTIAKVSFCTLMALCTILRTDRMMYWLFRGILNTGVLVRLLGMQEIEQYGQRSQ